MSIAPSWKLMNLHIARLSNAAAIGTTESEFNNYILDSEHQMDNYKILCCDRNKKWGGVACYIRNYLSYIEKDFFPEEIKNIFFETLIPKTKPITVGIIYQPHNQSSEWTFCQTWYSQKRIIHSQWLQYKLV